MARSASVKILRVQSFVMRSVVLGAWALSGLSGCAPEFEKLHRDATARGTLGADIYQALCRRVAGTEMPMDLEGRDSETLCLGDAAAARNDLSSRRDSLPPRLAALAQRRDGLVRAFDAVFPEDVVDDLEDLMQGLVPFYGMPDPWIPESTRRLAELMSTLAGNEAALREMARLGRTGMVPIGTGLGSLRVTAAHREISSLARQVLPSLFDGEGAEGFDTLRKAAAFELATTEPANADDIADLNALERAAFLAEAGGEGTFGTGTPLFTAARDERGMPVPSAGAGGALAFPFTDADRDGQADLNGDRLAVATGWPSALPEPFAVVGEHAVARDANGRACGLDETGAALCDQTLYAYSADRDPTLLSAVLQELPKLAGDGVHSVFGRVLAAIPALFESPIPKVAQYGDASLSYQAVDTEHSALLNLARVATSLIPTSQYDQSLELMTRLLADAEKPLAGAVSPWLEAERLTRPDADAYAEAVLPNDHTFWDELLFEAEKFSRRRRTRDGESALLAIARATLGFARDPAAPSGPLTRRVPLAELRHQGALLATLMRFKDEWRLNPRRESKRAPGEPGLIGAFRTPVARDQPDSPVTCGKDGCGGPIVGSPFESFQAAGQNCMVQRVGRPPSGRDCGAPSNQSIFHRSLGLLWEMAGRSQCNKSISISELLDFVADDVCATVADPASANGDPKLCTTDADCAGLSAEGVTDHFSCDSTRGQCIADKASAACQALKRLEHQRRDKLAVQAEDALAQDYVCSASQPNAACHAYESTYPAAFIDSDGAGPAVAAVQACHLLNMPDVGRTFGSVLTREFVLNIPNPWVRRYLEDVAHAGPNPSDPSAGYAVPSCKDVLPDFHLDDPSVVPPCIPAAARLTRDFYDKIPPSVDSLGELVEFLLDDTSLFASDADARDLRPDPKALSRVLFAPPGESSLALFEPLLLRGSPAPCSAAPGLPACSADDTVQTVASACCLADPLAPPLRYRLDTFYGSTSFAWEQAVAFEDGTQLSFLDTMGPLADAFNRLDYVAGVDDPNSFEDLSYGLTSLGKMVAEHYDSPANPAAQTTDPGSAWYRRGTGLVHYERLVADLLDDGLAVANQAGPDRARLFAEGATADVRSLDMWRGTVAFLDALDSLEMANGKDAIDVSVEVGESLLNPHAYCAGDGGDGRILAGKGACQAADRAREPLTRRAGGDDLCWNDGRCFDGSTPALPKRFLSPMTLGLEAAYAVTARGRDEPRLRQAVRGMFSAAFDAFAGVRAGQFSDRRLRAILLTSLAHARVVWAEEQAKGSLPAYAADAEHDIVKSFESTVFASAVDVLRTLSKDDATLAALDGFMASLGAPAQQRVWLATLSDTMATSHVPGAWVESARVFATALAPNVADVVKGGPGLLLLDGSFVDLNLRLLLETAKRDTHAVAGSLLRNLVTPTDALGGFAALDVLAEAVLAINRAAPLSPEALDVKDITAALTRMASVLTDEHRGFERLYRMIQCATSDGASKACD